MILSLSFLFYVCCCRAFCIKDIKPAEQEKMRDKYIRRMYDRLFIYLFIYCNWVFTRKICIKLGNSQHKLFIYLFVYLFIYLIN
jgi:hypothetical protein